MRVFKTKRFAKFQRKESIADSALVDAVSRAERGLVGADLGRSLIKKRIARAGHGRSGGYRTIIVMRLLDRAIFVFGFAKIDLGNMSELDELELADYGALLLELDNRGLALAIAAGELVEIDYDG